MANLDRRTLLGSAVAAAVTPKATKTDFPEGFSTDFREWFALAKTQAQVNRIDSEWCDTNPGADHRLSPFWRHCEALHRLEARIFAHVLDGPVDIHTVAEVGMIALFWSDKDERSRRGDFADYDPFELGCDPYTAPGAVAPGDRAQFVLIQAAAKLYLGGSHG